MQAGFVASIHLCGASVASQIPYTAHHVGLTRFPPGMEVLPHE